MYFLLIHSGYGRREMVDELRRLGYDPDEVLPASDTGGQRQKVYPENVRREVEEALRGLLVERS